MRLIERCAMLPKGLCRRGSEVRSSLEEMWVESQVRMCSSACAALRVFRQRCLTAARAQHDAQALFDFVAGLKPRSKVASVICRIVI
jgi:hypothetical protein